MRKTRKVLDWEGFGWIPPYVTSTQSRPVATVYSDVRVGCASRLMSCTYPVFTTRVYCAHLPPRYAPSRAVVLVAAEDLATSNLEVS